MTYHINIKSLLEKLGEFMLPSDLEEIRQIVLDIETRIQRFKDARERMSEAE
jgi:hypothetical protein